MRGEWIDIGGRRFRLVRRGGAPGAPGASPVVLFEAGSFGTAADWAAVEQEMDPRRRTLAYDRAGLGFSDPGPLPRDSRALTGDLIKLLSAAGERGPFVLVGHSMAGVHLFSFALRHPEETAGLVLIDAAPPAALRQTLAQRLVRTYQGAVKAAPLAAEWGVTGAVAGFLGDQIDVPEPAKSEKKRAFASAGHMRWSAEEVSMWVRSAEDVAGLGDLDRELPVAVVTAGGGAAALKRLQAEPARRSRSGYAVNIKAANHATLLGPRHARAVVKAIEFVLAAASA